MVASLFLAFHGLKINDQCRGDSTSLAHVRVRIFISLVSFGFPFFFVPLTKRKARKSAENFVEKGFCGRRKL